VGTSEYRQLKTAIYAADRERERRYDLLEARLDEHQARIDVLLRAERDAAREQVADQAVADEPDEEHAPPPPIEGFVPPPSPAEDIDQLAASSAMGSPAHMAWRRQHVPQSQPFGL
jgi:hypothetical protein